MVRIKHRYFLARLVFDDKRFGHDVDSSELYRKIKDAVRALHGEYGVACMDLTLSIKYINVYTNIVMIKTRRQFHRLLWSSLPFVTHINEKKGKRYVKTPCFLHTLYVGGTIRCCQKFLIKYHRKKLNTILAESSSPGERRMIKKSIESASLEENENASESDSAAEDD